MYQVRSSILFALVLALAAACGEKRLNDAEKAQFREFTRNSSLAFGAGLAAQKQQAGEAGPVDMAAEDEKEVRRKMTAAMTDGSCNISPITSGSPSLKINQNITVDGPNCPIDMKMNMNMKFALPVVIFSLDASYTIKQDSFAQLSDILSAQFKGDFRFTAHQTGSSMTASGDMKGAFQSKNHGNVPFRGKTFGTMGSGGGEITSEFVYEFKTLPRVKASVTFNGQGVFTYRLNGEKLTKEQWEDFFDQALYAQGALPPTK